MHCRVCEGRGTSPGCVWWSGGPGPGQVREPSACWCARAFASATFWPAFWSKKGELTNGDSS